MEDLITTQKTLSASQKEQLFTMWDAEFPASVVFDDVDGFEQYLAKLKNIQHYIIDNRGDIDGWLCTMEREQLPWFIIIVKKNAQGKGYGKSLIERAMKDNDILRGWMVAHDGYQRSDGSAYPSPSQFYTKLGFSIQPDVTITKGGITSTRIEWRR